MELSEVLEKIYQKLTLEITNAYYDGKVEEVLKKYGLTENIEYSYYDKNNSRILVIGSSMVNKDDMIGIAKRIGISSNKLEFELDYDRLTNFDFGKLRNSIVYSDILVGPMPHKVLGIDGYSSFLAMVQDNIEEFPKVTVLESANGLKITKESFKNGLLNTRMYDDTYNK